MSAATRDRRVRDRRGHDGARVRGGRLAPWAGTPWMLAAIGGALALAIHAAGADWSPWALVALVALVVLIADSQARAAHRRDRAAFDRLLSDARLETLRARLDPHFVFNALNAISAHLEQDPRAARWMIDELGGLLRMSLEQASEQETPLARELDFIGCYLRLQKARFDDRLTIVTTIAPDVGHALVPSLVLQPLVENAIRHGVAKQAAARIAIRAWRAGDELRLHVEDDGPGLPADWDPEHGLGVGLSITRERLERLYGAAQRFTIAGVSDVGADGDGESDGAIGAATDTRAGAATDADADADARTQDARAPKAANVGSASGTGSATGTGVRVSLAIPFRPAPDADAGVETGRAATAAGAARIRIADDSPGS